MRQKIRYVIHVIGQETDYLSWLRGTDPVDAQLPNNEILNRNWFKCTRDMQAYSTGLYSPLQWREFNCQYVVTHLNMPITIEVREETK